MSVAVMSKAGIRLMPTSEYRARKLLRSKKATIYRHDPFTIQLTERETGDVQPVELCMDTGYLHIGMSVKSEKHEHLSIQIDTLTDEKQKHDVGRDVAERDTASHDSRTEDVTTDGSLCLWSIKKISISG